MIHAWTVQATSRVMYGAEIINWLEIAVLLDGVLLQSPTSSRDERQSSIRGDPLDRGHDVQRRPWSARNIFSGQRKVPKAVKADCCHGRIFVKTDWLWIHFDSVVFYCVLLIYNIYIVLRCVFCMSQRNVSASLTLLLYTLNHQVPGTGVQPHSDGWKSQNGDIWTLRLCCLCLLFFHMIFHNLCMLLLLFLKKS